MKTQILAAIGESELRPAARLNAALAANDRVKYAFSLLQMALAHAEHPEQPAPTLKRERIACGVDDPDLDVMVARARREGKLRRAPGAGRLLARIADDMRVMAAPVLAEKAADFAARLDQLLAAMPAAENDLVDPGAISAMTQAGHDRADSLHRLVMDLHKRLNAMQAALAEENLDGAAAYNLAEADRPLVSAFMAGLNRTAKLKFAHPGLATTATRAGARLIIQNDIGTTDAHVIVIHVEGLKVSVTYTDVHPERLAFFQDMLKPRKVAWEQQRTDVLAAGSAFYLATGRIEALDEAGARSYLEFLGSRLVFLIDWNRARKQLRGFLRGPDRLALLSWAAETEMGHRGFLELGGARLVNQAIEAAAGSSMHFGDRLCDVLGDAETLDFLRFVFQASTEGLLTGQSRALIHDRIRVTLGTHFSNEEQQLLRLAADHAGLIFEIASLVRDGLQAEPHGAAKRARRARQYEHDADGKVVETRVAVARRPDYAVFLRLLEAADDAADQLEDAASLLGLRVLEGKAVDALQILADLLVEGAQEWIKALGHATQIGRAASHAETEDFLTAIDRVAAIEHQADDAERALAASALQHASDFRQLHLFTSIGERLEEAADALKYASLILHEHMLEDVIDA
ncbi:conserved hypothetical protein [Methylocella tundrae]|uniref:Phosphate transport regulator n=1 Tax=Methylocella tundrae TaxID=227605 RepID=A0A8B6MAV2_METTU|nr:DUF47 family protein [Methylocella tundrae]VTZ25369.1 conserved hypothetical protein [Methylocella tundrae]VTZ52022.1 conserved hypothetical protein [Methylocella tundrae]